MEIRIYVEGGGDQRAGKSALKSGISQFLNPLRELARQRRMGFQVIACGSRNAAFDDFRIALRAHPEAINLLLVDAEGAVQQESPWDHLRQCDPSWRLPNLSDTHCHLMAQTMEAWVVADINALCRYYGQGFNRNPFPPNPNVESIPKERLERSLNDATRNTAKGQYHKIRHGPEILAQADPSIVCGRAYHCRRLFETISRLIEG